MPRKQDYQPRENNHYLTQPGRNYIHATKEHVLPPIPSTGGKAKRLTREEMIKDFSDGLD